MLFHDHTAKRGESLGEIEKHGQSQNYAPDLWTARPFGLGMMVSHYTHKELGALMYGAYSVQKKGYPDLPRYEGFNEWIWHARINSLMQKSIKEKVQGISSFGQVRPGHTQQAHALTRNGYCGSDLVLGEKG
ncbi:hypothetical protein PG989_011928 [Apiospora arundinis]